MAIRMMDTFSEIDFSFENGSFSMEKWEAYANSIYENFAEFLKKDMEDCLDGREYTYEKTVLPVLNAVYGHPALEELHMSFLKVTDGLNERIKECFGNGLEIDIVLYVGLCNGAGWVTNIDGRDTILLGIEKILELDWQDIDSMYGLIYHELGHAFHKQHGNFLQTSEDTKQSFVWQLFTEGIAIYFEQVLVGDTEYYHQNRDGWKTWCDEHFVQIITDFQKDLPEMTRQNQRYFGDWVSYCGRGDVGYYLGTKFVHRLCERYRFAELIRLGIEDVYEEYLRFAEANKMC